MLSAPFQRLPRSVLQTKSGHRLFESVATDVREQVEEPPWTVRPDRAASFPPAAQVVYWLWLFQCEAGGGGFGVFLSNSLGVYAPQVHAALKAVGADELALRLEAAIPLARRYCPEFSRLADQSWFDQWRPVPGFDSPASVDRDAYPLISALSDAASEFIASHADALFVE